MSPIVLYRPFFQPLIGLAGPETGFLVRKQIGNASRNNLRVSIIVWFSVLKEVFETILTGVWGEGWGVGGGSRGAWKHEEDR